MPKGRLDVEDQSIETSKEEEFKKRKKKPKLSIDSTALKEPSETAPLSSKKTFSSVDFAKLSENEHSRYVPNSEKVGHAVILEKANGVIAAQYTLPAVKDDTTPEVRPLINIEAIEPFRGMHRYRAETPDGKTKMYAKRFIEGKYGDKHEEHSVQIACFSPSAQKGKEPFWGSIRPTPVFRDNLSKGVKKDLEKELKDSKQVTKGGSELVVDHASVPKRDLIKTRTPDQNTIMGESARDAYENFFDSMVDELHPEMKQRLKRAFTADLKDHFTKNNYRPEWLHAKGWSLMPMDLDPQTEENLGAGPKWANTQMMILERVIKWFAINSPESLLTIKPKFDMLLDSEIIKHIDFKVKIQIKDRFFELAKSIDPFQPYPIFPKASDIAQTTGIAHSILHEVAPTSQQVIKGAKKSQKEVRGHRNTDRDKVLDTSSSSSEEESDSKERIAKVSAKKPSKESDETSHKRKRNVQFEEDASKPKRAKYPTQQQHDRSVVQVYTDSFTPDYDSPWRDPESCSFSGSGFVIEDELGKKYVVTNAHVAENPIFLQIRLANDRHKKYEAKVKCVSYQCDLALLEIDDPEFNTIAQPVELGDMVDLRQKIMVVGFPVGGTEMSISRGIVSRIQVDTYSTSDQNLLQVQVDAAINPGNSGGPTFSDGKVVGVAFQGYDGHQGLGYIIPIPIVRHFLKEALSGNPYRGFPTLPIHIEELENPHERAFYKLGKKTGVRIKKVDNLSDAFNKLKPDDILLSIDDLPISNEGTVDIPGIGNCIDYFYVTQSKFIGDKVTLRILRKNADTQLQEELTVEVVLDTILGDTEKVAVAEHDKMPTFYINSGISFIPLTRNYMGGEGSSFEEMHLLEEGCTLPDAPKKNPDEQIVIINSILKCNETQGYDKHVNGIVKEINGKKISNFNDVVSAMEKYKGKRHVISLASNSKIIVPNLSTREHARLLKKHFISHDRSADLMAIDAIDMTRDKEKEELTPTSKKPFSLGLFATTTKDGKHHLPPIEKEDLTESSDEEEVDGESNSKSSDEEGADNLLTKVLSPNFKVLQEKLSALEKNSSKDDTEEEENEEIDDLENIEDESEEESEEEDEETEAEKDTSSAASESSESSESSPKLKRQNGTMLNFLFFKTSSSDDDKELSQKNRSVALNK